MWLNFSRLCMIEMLHDSKLIPWLPLQISGILELGKSSTHLMLHDYFLENHWWKKLWYQHNFATTAPAWQPPFFCLTCLKKIQKSFVCSGCTQSQILAYVSHSLGLPLIRSFWLTPLLVCTSPPVEQLS